MDTVPGFGAQNLELKGEVRCVYKAGSGPAVIVMSEIPGITPAVAQFAQRVVDAGHTVFMPLLFGEPMRKPEVGYALRVTLKACISREFHVLASDRSSPIVDWLRALARHAHAQCARVGTGAVAAIAALLGHPLPAGRTASLAARDTSGARQDRR